MKVQWIVLFALISVACAPRSSQNQVVVETVMAQLTASATYSRILETTPLPSATAQPKPTSTRTPSPTRPPTTPTPDICPVFEDVCIGDGLNPLEERDRLLLEQAYKEDRFVPCKKEGDKIWACPNALVYSNDAVHTVLALPAYNKHQVLPANDLEATYHDVSDPVLERQFQLLDSIGFRGSVENKDLQSLLWCVPGSPRYWCPEGSPNAQPLRREVATVWALLGVFGLEWRPAEAYARFFPCDVFATDKYALWIESTVQLGVKHRGLEPLCYFPDDYISQKDFHVLVELLLDYGGLLR